MGKRYLQLKTKKVYSFQVLSFIWNKTIRRISCVAPLWMAKIAHPDRFKDVDIRAEIKRFYREIFEYELSEEQVDKILAGEYASAVGGLSGGYSGGQQAVKNK